MKDLYLYGASDDCMEVEGDFGSHESYVGIEIKCSTGTVRVHYKFDGDWGIWLEGTVPGTWIVRSFMANCASSVRDKPFGGQFIHIKIPQDENLEIIELVEDEW